jgi:uncharacterized protein (DUF1800 family)
MTSASAPAWSLYEEGTLIFRLSAVVMTAALAFAAEPPGAGPASWVGDLAAIGAADWNYQRAAHLLERAGFGGTPEEIQALAAMSPQEAVRHLVRYQSVKDVDLPAFHETGIYPTKDFCRSCNVTAAFSAVSFRTMDSLTPEQRAYFTSDAITGVTPEEKRIARTDKQAIVDMFYYYRFADIRETSRLADWLANRMVRTRRPLQEKLVLFWHGHFATGNDKVFDYRKMMGQFAMLRDHAKGNLRDLLIGIGKDPAMLVYLDNRTNVKGHPNENFAREIMELFSLGVGNYTETDIKEAARAFTGWSLDGDRKHQPWETDLEARRRILPGSLVNNGNRFVWKPELHDEGVKHFLGKTGNFKGEDIVDIILQQPACSHFIARKLYRFFGRQDFSQEFEDKLAASLRQHNYEIAPFLEQVFLSKDFYSPATYATQIKSPVQLVVSTYKKLGLASSPSYPDFADLTASLGQSIFNPPNVKGWDGGETWINPATIFERGNVIRDILFPEEKHEARDAYLEGSRRLSGDNIHQQFMAWAAQGNFGDLPSTGVPGKETMAADPLMKGGMPGAETMKANGEDFNVFRGVFNGTWFAHLTVPAAPRKVAQFELAAMLKKSGVTDATGVVDAFTHRFLRAPITGKRRDGLIAFCASRLGGSQVNYASWNLERELREVLHLILSSPEYELS